MHVSINVKSPNNISKWQMGVNSAFKGLKKIRKYPKCKYLEAKLKVSLRFMTKLALKDILEILVHIKLKLLARMILGTLKFTLCKKFHFMAGG
jgi:hypothetical protein